MIDSSPRIRGIVEAFAASLGLTARAEADGSYSFVLSRSGILSFTPSGAGERLLVSLSRGEAGPRTENEWRLIHRAGFDAIVNKCLHCGLDEADNMVHAFEFGESELDLPTLDLAVQRLIEAQES
jgi:hypothetical protein